MTGDLQQPYTLKHPKCQNLKAPPEQTQPFANNNDSSDAEVLLGAPGPCHPGRHSSDHAILTAPPRMMNIGFCSGIRPAIRHNQPARCTPTNALHPDERNAPRRTQRTPTSATHSDERDATWAHPNEPEAQAPGPAERQRRTRPHFTRTHCSQSSATRAPCTPTSATPHEPTPTSATPHGYLARWPAGSISRCFALHAARGARAVQQTAARAAAAVAGGIWVRTWSMRSHPVHIELSTVVSEMGEH